MALYDASGLMRRSTQIKRLLHAMKGEGGSDLPDVLDDKYADWLAYVDKDDSDLSLLELFRKWARKAKLPLAKLSAAETVFKQQATLPLNEALDRLVQAARRGGPRRVSLRSPEAG